MQNFTAFQYLLIDVANNHHSGLDKSTFDVRLDWALTNIDNLEAEAEGIHWKERPMYLKAVKAVEKARKGEPTGHLVGFDAVCSGMQIMSALMNCEAGARATGLIDPNVRADAYTECTKYMSEALGGLVQVDRKAVKQAVMTSLYGSKAEPKKVFGEDTPELEAFYKAMYRLCPGACTLLEDLVASWQPYATMHAWRLPDGFNARVKVMLEDEHAIEVDELGGTRFTYKQFVNAGKKKDVKNAANVVHSIDAYILRTLVRRCNYDPERVQYAYNMITDVIISRELSLETQHPLDTPEMEYYNTLYQQTTMADIAIIPYLDHVTTHELTSAHLAGLRLILTSMLEHEPFEIVTVHDDFKCLSGNVNHMRKHYASVLAELSESTVLDSIFSDLFGKPMKMISKNPSIAADIRNCNYALS